MTDKYWNTHEPEKWDFPVLTAGGRVRNKYPLNNCYSCRFGLIRGLSEAKLPCDGCWKDKVYTKHTPVGWLPAREIAAAIKYRPESEDDR